MGGMRELTSNYILMLPEKWDISKSGSANQNIIQFLIKKKNRAQKIKKCIEFILVCTASKAGGRSRGAGFNNLARTRFELRSITAAMWNFPAFRPECASSHPSAGWLFCWSGGGSALLGNAQKGVFVFRFFQSVASDTKQSVFNPTLYGLRSINK